MPEVVASPQLGLDRAPGSILELKPAEAATPARSDLAPGVRLVWAVIPCFNRPADLALVLEDLTALDLTTTGVRAIDAQGARTVPPPAAPVGSVKPGSGNPVHLKVVVVDNASATPLSALKVPAGLDLEFLRLNQNTGGAGGYNAGMAHAISEGRRLGTPPEFVWLVDSDVRLEPGALRGLIDCLDARPDAVAAGSAIADMQDASIFEVGGRVERMWGQFGPRYGGENMPKKPVIECTYTAACSALVRREAIEQTGLFPDVFLNADDVEWFIRMAKVTGKKVLATTESVVRHPFFGRYATMPRYYMSRNCFGPLDALGLGWRCRLFRAMRDVPRAVAQIMIGRDDLAELHLKGIEHASQRLQGQAPAGTIEFERPRAFETLAQTLRPHIDALKLPAGKTPEVYLHKRVVLPLAKADELHRQLAMLGLSAARIQRGFFNVEHEKMFHGFWKAIWRVFVAGPTAEVALIHARGRPMAWCRGRVQVVISQDGYVIRDLDRNGSLGRGWRAFWRGMGASWRVAMRKPAPQGLSPLPQVDELARKLPAMTA